MRAKRAKAPTTQPANDHMDPRLNRWRDTILLEIAKKYLGIETFEARNSDRLDFSNHAVWALKAALIEAMEAGRAIAEGAK